ncbi:hypothetical protein pb186bvf_012623 [Paramecium bursaria]
MKSFIIKKNNYTSESDLRRKSNTDVSLPKQTVSSYHEPPKLKQQASMIEITSKFQSQDLSFILSGHEDEMRQYKYKCNNPIQVRLEKIQDLVFKKKLQNRSKYTEKSKVNRTAIPVPKGTCSIMLNSNKKRQSNFDISAINKKIPARSRFKMKWKTIQWLMSNKKEAIHQLFTNYGLMIKYAKNKKEGMDKNDFQELLSYVGLGTDPHLTEKLFYIFDEDGSGTVDYKELIIGLEVFKEDSIEDKMKVFFDLCDVDGSGEVTQKELYEVLRANIVNNDDRIKLKKTIQILFEECDMNGDGVLDKNEVLEAAKNNITLRQLLESSVRDVKQIDQLIDNDLHEQFNEWVPASANFVNYKEGVHFPWCNKILRALKEVEDIYEYNRVKKLQFVKEQE